MCRLYRAKEPMCTHAYLLRSSAAAATLLAQAGNISDPWAAADYAMLRAVRQAAMHAYVMLPPPVAQLPHDVPPSDERRFTPTPHPRPPVRPPPVRVFRFHEQQLPVAVPPLPPDSQLRFVRQRGRGAAEQQMHCTLIRCIEIWPVIFRSKFRVHASHPKMISTEWRDRSPVGWKRTGLGSKSAAALRSVCVSGDWTWFAAVQASEHPSYVCQCAR